MGSIHEKNAKKSRDTATLTTHRKLVLHLIDSFFLRSSVLLMLKLIKPFLNIVNSRVILKKQNFRGLGISNQVVQVMPMHECHFSLHS